MPENTHFIKIPPDEIHYDFVQSSGPGGQNVNKVATAVQLRFDARNSKILKPAVREKLYRLAGKRINSAGELIIEARRYRTQQRNRERLLRLIERASIPPKRRRKTQPTAASKLRRLDSKRRRSEIKKLRKRSSMED